MVESLGRAPQAVVFLADQGGFILQPSKFCCLFLRKVTPGGWQRIFRRGQVAAWSSVAVAAAFPAAAGLAVRKNVAPHTFQPRSIHCSLSVAYQTAWPNALMWASRPVFVEETLRDVYFPSVSRQGEIIMHGVSLLQDIQRRS